MDFPPRRLIMHGVHNRAPRWRLTWRRRVALGAVVGALLAASLVTASDDDFGNPAIPPGEEQVVATMLGRGVALQYCTLVSGGVEYSVIKGTYNCLTSEATFELRHPRYATAGSTQTEKFVITLASGSAPPGFQDVLTSLVRSHERDFQWSWPEYDPAARGDDAAE
jgi:hypothetical protein